MATDTGPEASLRYDLALIRQMRTGIRQAFMKGEMTASEMKQANATLTRLTKEVQANGNREDLQG